MKYFLDISYEGTNYHGWQEQKNARGIQEVIGKAISLIIKSPVKLTGSGRTDSGVHALGQVAHMETELDLNPENLCHRLNRFLPHDISVNRIYRVNDLAHARYSAVARTYEYRIIGHKDPLQFRHAWILKNNFRAEDLNEISAILMEFTDYQAFSRVKTDVNNFYCRISSARWEREGSLLKFTIRSDRFLRGMVRAIVGTIVDASMGRISAAGFREIIQSRDRRQAGQAAPAYGLYLVKVEYPEDILVEL